MELWNTARVYLASLISGGIGILETVLFLISLVPLLANHFSNFSVPAAPDWAYWLLPLFVGLWANFRVVHELRMQRDRLDALFVTPDHVKSLKQVLAALPHGEPGGPPSRTLMWNALHDHLPNSPIWNEQTKYRTLIAKVNTDMQSLNDRLECAIRERNLQNTYASSMLYRRSLELQERQVSEFPDEYWWVREGENVLRLGPDAIAGVSTGVEAVRVAVALRELWDAMPHWAEVDSILVTRSEIPKVRDSLNLHIAEISNSTWFPGRCHLCNP